MRNHGLWMILVHEDGAILEYEYGNEQHAREQYNNEEHAQLLEPRADGDGWYLKEQK